MAKITTITNPLTGQPAQVDQLDHTAQQIDDAIARALPGGAIDSVLSSKPNPNLLDNWYFGNPVDQRGGYIQFGGTMMYKDPELTVEFGASSGTTPVVMYSTYARPIDQGIELKLYIKRSDCVRGYTGGGYTVDRWIANAHQITISNGIALPADDFYFQKIEQSTMDALSGKQITFSVLTTSNVFLTGSWVVDNTVQSDSKIAENNEFALYRSPWTGNGWGIATKTATHILAAKLELGSTQTLAHQENGVWVLNEIPDFGEQLARCQRYQCPIGGIYPLVQKTGDNTWFWFNIPLPKPLRANPQIDLSKANILSWGSIVSGFSFSIFEINDCSLVIKAMPTGSATDVMVPALYLPNGTIADANL